LGQDSPIVSICLERKRVTIDSVCDGLIEGCQHMQSILSENATSEKFKTNNLWRILLLRGVSAKGERQNREGDWDVVASSMISQSPQKAEKLRTQLAKGVGH
jgi:hypothetical protein